MRMKLAASSPDPQAQKATTAVVAPNIDRREPERVAEQAKAVCSPAMTLSRLHRQSRPYSAQSTVDVLGGGVSHA